MSASGDVAVIIFRRPAVIGVVDVKIGERDEGTTLEKEMQTHRGTDNFVHHMSDFLRIMKILKMRVWQCDKGSRQ